MSNRQVLKLYVVSDTAISKKVIKNIKQFLKEAKIEYSLEVIDVLENPELAVDAGVAATPTLVKEAPPPVKKIVGIINDKKKLFDGLGILE
ncbi:MAG: circadian clock KaiB family protein [Gammaproteobacteria bacterium]|jgi:circadian clock protein KaiB